MRVLVVTQMWPAPGAPQLGAFVARQVEAMRALGATVEVATIPPGPGGIRAPLKWHALYAAARTGARQVAPEVVLGHFLFPGGEAARRAARIAGAPLVVTCHGQDVANAERSTWLRRRTQRVLDESTALVAVSAALGDRLGAVCDLPPRVEHVDMGVDLSVFRFGDRDVAAHGLGREPSRPVVVQVGIKNVARLAAAFAIVRGRTGSGELWLVGAGDVRAVAGQEGVRHIGPVAPAVVGRILRAADCAAFVSEREGFGLAAVEALACGVPLVASSAVPVASILPASCTVLVDPTDVAAIAVGIEQALDLQRDDLAGAAVAADHAIEGQARRVLDLLSEVRHRGRRAPGRDDRIR